MNYNNPYPQLIYNPGCYKCGYHPKPPMHPPHPAYPAPPAYPCPPGGHFPYNPHYPYKPHYPALPPKPCKPCAANGYCCYPPNVPPPPAPDCCDEGCGDGDAPCCRNGSCAGCAEYTNHLPYLMPRAIGCGKAELCKQPFCLPLDPDCLDNGRLPGRPPHTIVGVTNTGAAVVESCLESDNADSTYDYYVRVKIPVDVVIRDCAGYTHCLKSWFAQKIKIPLTFRTSCLPKNPLIYARAKVSLCYSTKTETETVDLTLPENQHDYLDICDEETPGESMITFDKCPKLSVSVAACIIKLVPCGSPYDPYKPGPKVPCTYPC